MAHLIGTKEEVINGQRVLVKVFSCDRNELAGYLINPRYQKRNTGARWLARECGKADVRKNNDGEVR